MELTGQDDQRTMSSYWMTVKGRGEIPGLFFMRPDNPNDSGIFYPGSMQK